MSVSILLITHDDIGNALLSAAAKTLGEYVPLPTTSISISYDTDLKRLIPKLRRSIRRLAKKDGVLILTDIFGSTPSNIAQQLQVGDQIEIISGLSLPMLIRVFNYPQLPLKALAEKALSGGKDGICRRSFEVET